MLQTTSNELFLLRKIIKQKIILMIEKTRNKLTC
jgi:hypothetical protein